MHKGYVAALLALVLTVVVSLSFAAHGQGHTTQVKLSINNTANTVYIPGVGEVPAGSIGFATYSSPPHYYLASYSGGYMTGLVAGDGELLEVSSTGSYHSLKVDQDSEGKALLVFSGGDWNSIEKEIVGVESGKFLKYPSPSFGFGLGGPYPLTVILSYTDIDIEGSIDQSKGLFGLSIENKGVLGSRPVVEIGKS